MLFFGLDAPRFVDFPFPFAVAFLGSLYVSLLDAHIWTHTDVYSLLRYHRGRYAYTNSWQGIGGELLGSQYLSSPHLSDLLALISVYRNMATSRSSQKAVLTSCVEQCLVHLRLIQVLRCSGCPDYSNERWV